MDRSGLPLLARSLATIVLTAACASGTVGTAAAPDASAAPDGSLPFATPAAPASLTAEALSADAVRLRWQDQASNETAFRVERSSDGVSFAQAADLPLANIEEHVDTGLTAQTTYYYRVTARNAQGDSSCSNVASATTLSAAPDAAPAIWITSPPAGATVTGVVAVVGTASDVGGVAKVEVQVDGGSFATAQGTLSWTYSLSTATLTEGTHSLTARVTDITGNTATASRTFLVSRQPVAAGTVIDHTNYDPASASALEVAAAAALDVYFEHASVGGNICAGLDALQTSNPRYTCDRIEVSAPNAAWFGTHDGLQDYARGNPGAEQKVAHFETSLTPTLAAALDVATYKFCYIDSPDDPAALFATVKASYDRLRAKYPAVTFVWWTMPIETGGSAERQAFNDLIRAHCAQNNLWLFDIAALESHDEAGNAIEDNQGLELLYDGYTTDGGHLNGAGGLKIAKAFWKLLVEIAKSR